MNMKKIVFCLLAILAGCDQLTSSPAPKKKAAESPEQQAQYIAALGVANDFCRAWKAADFDLGRTLLSRSLILRYPEDQLRDAIRGSGNPQHAAFEISAGQSNEIGGYVFPVKLYFRYSGERADRTEVSEIRMILARDPSENWRVETFPIPDTASRLR
jgi:hypothetical protein